MKKNSKIQRMKILLVCSLAAAVLITTGSAAMAADQLSPNEIAEMTKKVVDILNAEGKEAFPELRKDEFVHGWAYPTICDLNGQVLFHPIKPKLEGRSLLAMKDKNGKLFVAELIAVARQKGSGWVDYVWPKPGEKKVSKKVAYVMKGTCDGVDIMCMVGLYDVTKEFCEKEAGR